MSTDRARPTAKWKRNLTMGLHLLLKFTLKTVNILKISTRPKTYLKFNQSLFLPCHHQHIATKICRFQNDYHPTHTHHETKILENIPLRSQPLANSSNLHPVLIVEFQNIFYYYMFISQLCWDAPCLTANVQHNFQWPWTASFYCKNNAFYLDKS